MVVEFFERNSSTLIIIKTVETHSNVSFFKSWNKGSENSFVLVVAEFSLLMTYILLENMVKVNFVVFNDFLDFSKNVSSLVWNIVEIVFQENVLENISSYSLSINIAIHLDDSV